MPVLAESASVAFEGFGDPAPEWIHQPILSVGACATICAFTGVFMPVFRAGGGDVAFNVLAFPGFTVLKNFAYG